MFVCGLHHMVTGSASWILMPTIAHPGEFIIGFADRRGLTDTSARVGESLYDVLGVLSSEASLPFEDHYTPPLDYRRLVEFAVHHVPRAVARRLWQRQIRLRIGKITIKFTHQIAVLILQCRWRKDAGIRCYRSRLVNLQSELLYRTMSTDSLNKTQSTYSNVLGLPISQNLDELQMY